MDRPLVYAGQNPLETDNLRLSQYAMVGLAKLSEAVLGTVQAVAGFTLAPTAPASLSAVLGPGVVFQQAQLEATPFSTLPADGHTVVKQGILLDAQTLTFTPPAAAGYAQNFLVEVQYQDADAGATVLPYYNAANPQVGFSGPGGAGTAQNTVRRGAVAYQIKAGVAATAGTQTSPAPDAGWAGIYVVTLAQGATSITAGNITLYAGAPFIPVTLPGVPNGVQSGQWEYLSVSGLNAYTGTLSPAPATLTANMEVLGFFGTGNTAAAPTLNVGSFGVLPILKQGGGAPAIGDLAGFMPLILNGSKTAWVINGLVASDIAPHAGRLIAVQTFIVSGPYTPSPGMTYIVVEGVGGGAAGGGAGGATSTYVSLGAPGTAGCYGRAFYTAAQIGTSQSVIIGAGGAPVSGGIGGNGGQTYFGSLLGLPGGIGGNTLTNQTAPTVNGNGATSAAGTGANITQTPGGVSSVSTAYTSNVGASGAGGTSLLGTGGYVVFINSTAAPATGFGAGGGTVIVNASGGTLFGGAGSGGKLIITEFGY